MLYLTVLALEFFPVPAEEFGTLAGIRRFLVKLRMPLVITGIGLSTLHQSSLGSLFLIMPYRLHPLWYSPLLPVLFLVSAIGLGLMMVILESNVTAFLYRRKPETEVLAGLETPPAGCLPGIWCFASATSRCGANGICYSLPDGARGCFGWK